MEIMKTFDEIIVNDKSAAETLAFLSNVIMDNYTNPDFLTKFIVSIGKEEEKNDNQSNGFRSIVNIELYNPKVRVDEQGFFSIEDKHQSIKNIKISELNNFAAKQFISDNENDWGGAEPLYVAYKIIFTDKNSLDYRIIVRVYTEKGRKLYNRNK